MKLVTNRCVVRTPVPEDASSLARHANNRGIWLNVRDAFPHPYSIEDARKWIASVMKLKPAVGFIIEVNGEACGGIGLRRRDDVERVAAELGYWLGEEYWGRGITTEAVKAVTDYGLTELGLTRVFAVPMTHNEASFRVLEKAGFQREGTMRKAALKDGEIVDMALYARVKE